MSTNDTELIYSETPSVTIATNTFQNVPTILQFEETPLIEVVRVQQAGFTTSIPIYHQDGTYLAKVVGSRLFSTSDGDKAGITLEHPDQMTVCKLNGKTIFEIRRRDAASLSTQAELYTPEGYFVRTTDSPELDLLDASGSSLQLGGVTMARCMFTNCRIGILVKKDGSVAIGVS